MPDIALDPGSPAERIALFFLSNPDEALARADVAAKLSIAPGAVEAAMEPAVTAGLITIANSVDLGRVWRAGPRLKHWNPQPQLSEQPKPKTSRGGKRRLLPVLKVASLQVSHDLPCPGTRFCRPGSTRHDDLFDTLTADGMSVTGIPAAYTAALMKAVQGYVKGRPNLKESRLLVRRIDDETCGVWRVAKAPPAAVVAPVRNVTRAA
jgi:hypothetical protein